MKFEHPIILQFIWALIPIGILFLWFIKRRKKILQKFAQQHLLSEIATSFSQKAWQIKYILLILVLLFSIAALARPQWGFEWQEIKRKGIDILMVVDVSKSMLTQDVKPNRLERTKLAIKDLIKKLKGDRIGLVAFAGDAFLMCPLTVDYGGFVLTLDDLNTNTVPRGGKNISQAISVAINQYIDVPNQYKAIIIMTDGENLEGDPLALAKKAKEKGIKIYTVGIGTKEGELIQMRGQDGSLEFFKDGDGNFVKSRLNEKLLQEIALTTSGAYVKASGAQFGLDLIYDKELATLERRDIQTKMEKRYFERFQIPLGIAVLLLMVETCISTRRRI